MSSKGPGVRVTGGVRVGGQPLGSSSLPWQPAPKFDRSEFEALLTAHGRDVVWEKMAYCPNRRGSDLKQHKVDCTLCPGGNGIVYYDSKPTRMLIHSVSARDMFYQYGRWENGQISVTALPEFRLHMFDKLTLTNSVARFQEVVARSRTASDRLKYTPLEIFYAAYVSRAGALVEVDPATIILGDDGTITWSDEYPQRPDGDGAYTISYSYAPVYIVMDLVHHHRNARTATDEEIEFPVMATARLDFLARDDEKEDEPAHQVHSPFPGR